LLSTASHLLIIQFSYFDNHESHMSVDGIQFAKDDGIHLLSFPAPNSTGLRTQ